MVLVFFRLMHAVHGRMGGPNVLGRSGSGSSSLRAGRKSPSTTRSGLRLEKHASAAAIATKTEVAFHRCSEYLDSPPDFLTAYCRTMRSTLNIYRKTRCTILSDRRSFEEQRPEPGQQQTHAPDFSECCALNTGFPKLLSKASSSSCGDKDE